MTKAESDKRWREKNPDYLKNYYQKNKEKFREYGRKRYEKMPEEYNEKGKKYRDENKDKYREMTRIWRELNPHKVKAHNTLHVALENGSVVKEICLFCNNVDVEGHHEDYNKPLEVIWLCRKHHQAEHRKIHKRIRGRNE